MKVLVGCEESQEVTKAFRAKGHEAYSCDILDCSGGHPEWHFKGDVFEAITKGHSWDIIILHPPCTALAVSGNAWYGQGMAKNDKRIEAIEWTLRLWNTATDYGAKVCLENPIGVLTHYLGKPQYIQPYQFGHKETKKTGLWLHNLEPLKPTSDLKEETYALPDNIRQRMHYMPPSKDRGKLRSKTYPGIAKAMAEQWG